ncbi:hypothetical protein K8R47_03320 [archaeon]|nr:hypothetical protein [archaeon]
MNKLEDIYKTAEAIWKLEINSKLKKELFDILIWKITEINGKYNTKYRSEGALGVKDVKQLHHEHVMTRKKSKEKLESAKSIEEIKKILDNLQACIVTREEHKKLDNKIDGWERYKKAGIKVFDVSGDKPKEYGIE